jgi:CRP-like cAMP-binding protein
MERNESSAIKNMLYYFCIFCSCTEEDLKEIEQHLSVLKIQNGQIFLHEGEICRTIFFVNEGLIRHYFNAKDNEVTRWISFKNEFTTSLKSFISLIPSRENLQSIGDCELVTLNKKSFDILIKTNESFKSFWIKALQYNYLVIEDRVFSLIEKSAEERFEWMHDNQSRFIEKVPAIYVASMLGISARHFSRLKKKFTD